MFAKKQISDYWFARTQNEKVYTEQLKEWDIVLLFSYNFY